MVKLTGSPVHVKPFTVLGVTVIVPEIGANVVLVAVNDPMLLTPVPDAPKPMLVLLFTQSKVTPPGVPEKLTCAVAVL